MVYILDGDVGSKKEKISQLIKQNNELDRKMLDQTIHILSKNNIEDFLLDAEAISEVFQISKSKVRKYLLNNQEKWNKYYVLKNLVKHFSPKDSQGRPKYSYHKRDGYKIVENMDRSSIDPEIVKILKKIGLFK